MVSKFPCPACGQRVSATPDLFGTQADCPACGTAFIVPTFERPGFFARLFKRSPAPQEPAPIELPPDAPLAARVRALGYDFMPPPEMEPEDLENALDEFLNDAADGFDQTLLYMEADGVIKARPTADQLREIGRRHLAQLLGAEESVGDAPESGLRGIILDAAPEIRA